MATKNVYFYKATLKEVISNKEVTNNIKAIFLNIFSTYTTPINNGTFKSMTLHHSAEEISLDILIDDDNWCFARVGKKKDPAYNVIRDNATKDYKYVLTNAELAIKTLEVCTYFLINYKTGLVGFIIGNDAPSVSVLVNIVNEFDQNYMMCIDNILNPESATKLVVPGAMLSKVKYTFRTPSVEALIALGLNMEQVTALGLMDISEIQLLVKSEPHKYLSKQPNNIEELVNSVRRLPQKIKESFLLIGKTPNTSSKPYGFKEENLYYSIEIPNDKIIDGKKVKFTPDEVANDICEKLKLLYSRNVGELMCMANIE